jgi:hypothetical protein
MTRRRSKAVFLSYSSKDKAVADRISGILKKLNYEVWIDSDKIRPGEQISTKISEGLKATDYFLLLISENSNQSPWVKQEVATAFRLSNEKKLAFVPVVLDDASVPFELEGVLYIKASREGLAGLKNVREFFTAENTTVSDLQGSAKAAPPPATSCEKSLGTLSLGALRLRMATKLSLVDISALWFDLFSRRMEDETNVHNLATSCIDLLDRARRQNLIPTLIALLCGLFPHVSSP